MDGCQIIQSFRKRKPSEMGVEMGPGEELQGEQQDGRHREGEGN